MLENWKSDEHKCRIEFPKILRENTIHTKSIGHGFELLTYSSCKKHI